MVIDKHVVHCITSVVHNLYIPLNRSTSSYIWRSLVYNLNSIASECTVEVSAMEINAVGEVCIITIWLLLIIWSTVHYYLPSWCRVFLVKMVVIQLVIEVSDFREPKSSLLWSLTPAIGPCPRLVPILLYGFHLSVLLSHWTDYHSVFLKEMKGCKHLWIYMEFHPSLV